MATNPYSWAARIGEQGQADKTNAQSWEQNALMQMFQTEAQRQLPYVQMPAQLAQRQYELEMAEPYQIAREQRALADDMALRRYYAENPIPRAEEEEAPAAGGPVVNPDGSTDYVVGGSVFRKYPDGRMEKVQ